ncbi:GerAB/ArcD/ProY family transporter [Wukongibacter sp. M2B1]|uniref:GerAB/ArcD/ProY family transporter n=1 Tax=Wukongibacter sp. M2B1 TaxID=3088895 RepID=UPI003D7B79AE
MKKEVISDKQGIAIIVLFIVGSSSIFAQGLEAKQDLWLAFVLGIIMVLPMIMIYARLHYIFSDKDLFDIVDICFGKLIGKVLIILYIWFVYYFSSDMLFTYGQFIRVVWFQETPQIIIIIFMGILCVLAIKEGIELLGRFSQLFFHIPIITLFIIIILLISDMNINNLRPVLKAGIKPILEGAFSVFTFPLVEIVMFTMAFSNFKRKKSPYKVFIIGLLIGGVYLLILSLTNILVIGVDIATNHYYPSHTTISRIDVGGILQRIEIVIAITYCLGGFIKISLLLLCVCKGVTKIFGFKDYRFIIIPISLLILNLSYFQYESVMYYFEWGKDVWPYYSFPFQVILPIIIWIVAEIKKKKLVDNSIT